MPGGRGLRWLRAPFCVAAVAALAGCADEEGSEVKTSKPGPLPIEIVGGAKKREGGDRSVPSGGSATAPVALEADYIARADATCARHRPRIRTLEKQAQEAADGGDGAGAAALLAEAVGVSEREVAELRRLPVPPGSEAELEDMYEGIEASNGLFRDSLGPLRDGDLSAFNTIADRARVAAIPSRRIAKAFGLRVCGRG